MEAAGPQKKINVERWGSLIALAVLALASALLSPHFLQPQNLLNILRQVSYTGIIGLGMTFVIIAGGIDLSVGSMAAFAGSMAIIVMNMAALSGWPAWLGVLCAVAAALAVGIAGGAANGAMVTKGRIAPFIVTLGTMAIFRSLSLYMADAGEFRSSNQLYGDIGSASLLFVPVPVWIMLAIAIVFALLLGRTRFGRYVRAVGSNQRVARYSAINVDRVRFLTYVINGLVTAVSAILISMRFNAVGSSTLGVNYEMDAIAAVVIGGTAMSGGSGTVWGTVIGAIILGVINNMLNMVGVSPYLQGTVKGLVIIGAVLIQRRKSQS
jgi:ribose transport system permease protein